MKDIKKIYNLTTIGTIILDLIIAVLGLFLISNPEIGMASSLTLIGLLMLITGIYAIVKYIASSSRFFVFELIYGILNVIVGILAITKPFEVANFITIIIGIWLVFNSVSKLAFALQIRKINNVSWLFDLVMSVLCIILGILIIINPFDGYIILTTYAGIMLLVYACMDIVEQLLIRKRINDITKFIIK